VTERDAGYLWDMLTAAREIAAFLEGRRFQDLTGDKMLRRAVERELEIIGEAARRMSPEFRGNHPEVPWPSIIGLRNVLAHEYGEVKLERIWGIVSDRIPELIRLLEPLAPRTPEDG